VVLDDAADPVELDHLLPQGRAGRVLITTRRNRGAWHSIAETAGIGVFTPAQSVRYLELNLKALAPRSPGILSEAAELAAELGYLPHVGPRHYRRRRRLPRQVRPWWRRLDGDSHGRGDHTAAQPRVVRRRSP